MSETVAAGSKLCPITRWNFGRVYSGRSCISARVMEVAAQYGLGVDDTREVRVVPEFHLDTLPGQVVFVTGASGGGKSTVLRQVVEQAKISLQLEKVTLNAGVPLVDLFGDSADAAMRLLGYVGLGEAFLALRKVGELSDGQAFRAHLAGFAALIEGMEGSPGALTLVADEFCSTLDRLTAQCVTRCFLRMVRKRGLTLFLASAHSDLIGAIDPDVLIDAELGWWRISERIGGKWRSQTLEI